MEENWRINPNLHKPSSVLSFAPLRTVYFLWVRFSIASPSSFDAARPFSSYFQRHVIKQHHGSKRGGHRHLSETRTHATPHVCSSYCEQITYHCNRCRTNYFIGNCIGICSFIYLLELDFQNWNSSQLKYAPSLFASTGYRIPCVT